MKTQLTVLAVGALLLAAAHADSSAPSIGRYQIVTNTEGTITWRVDTASGQVVECIALSSYHTLPDCYPARMQSKGPNQDLNP